jgi:hypothetical protein
MQIFFDIGLLLLHGIVDFIRLLSTYDRVSEFRLFYLGEDFDEKKLQLHQYKPGERICLENSIFCGPSIYPLA